jgi:hypothetical protein
MGGGFSTYMALKGLSKVVKFSLGESVMIGLAVGVPLVLAMRPVIRRQEQTMWPTPLGHWQRSSTRCRRGVAQTG